MPSVDFCNISLHNCELIDKVNIKRAQIQRRSASQASGSTQLNGGSKSLIIFIYTKADFKIVFVGNLLHSRSLELFVVSLNNFVNSNFAFQGSKPEVVKKLQGVTLALKRNFGSNGGDRRFLGFPCLRSPHQISFRIPSFLAFAAHHNVTPPSREPKI